MTSSLTQLCESALPLLNVSQPLVTRELHNELYVDRGERVMSKLLMRLKLGELAHKSKLVFSGHIGSGKSTELFQLKRTLERERRATIIYWSVGNYVNMVGLNATGLLEGMARALNAWLGERNDARPQTELDERIRRGHERFRRVRRHSEGASTGASVALNVGPAGGNLGLSSARSTTTELSYDELPDPTDMLLLVNEMIGAVRAKRPGDSAPVMLICDDLEKLDLKTAVRVFEDGLVLSSVDCCVIYTVPVSLLYSEHRRSLLGHFDDEDTILPLIKVRTREGEAVAESVVRLRDMVRPRIPHLERLLTDEAFQHLAEQSGGVVRDLLRMLRELCFTAIAEARVEPFDLAAVLPAEVELRNAFLRQIPRDLLAKLDAVRTDPTGRGGGMDADLGRLLNVAAVLEYHNGETWYRIHPLTDHLLKSA